MNAIEQLKTVKMAARVMVNITSEVSRRVLLELADITEANLDLLLSANTLDLARMQETDPRYDRLKLTPTRIREIAHDIRNVANLESPIGEVLEQRQMPNGLALKKVRVPLGVVGVIYEARPNVTFDVFALCFRSGNAVVLKGGSDADHSNRAIVELIKQCLASQNISEDILQLLPADRQAAMELMHAVGYVDVVIPRGSQGLIDMVRNNAKVPVIETGAGVVHTYFDETADLEIGQKVIFNAKTRRVSVCNALDCLIVHVSRLKDLPLLIEALAEKSVAIEADESSFSVLEGTYPENLLELATDDSFGKEHLSYRLTIKTVKNLDEALDHIARFSTRHSEAIISQSAENQRRFCNEVDAAAVYVNTSTAFTDGAQFGMGAEIGISTQKLHARGPMALPELTSYKWIIESNGLTRL
jgi:glutamate-5-semialdehyde dehydrogenase